jgi:hypothetical protein
MSKKNEDKTMVKKRREAKDDKKPNQKRRKGNKMLRKKRKGAEKNFDKKAIKMKEPKIKVLAHELLASTLSYLMLAPW